MASFRWTPERMEQLESAVRQRKRVTVRRRGNDFVVIATGLTTAAGRDAFTGYLAMSGQELTFRLDELDHFQVLAP